MIENDNQNSQQAASAAVRNAPKLAKIAQAGVQGGPAGAAAEAAVQYRKEVLVVAIAVMLLPVLVLIMLPGAIFGTLTQPSTAVNDDLEIAAVTPDKSVNPNFPWRICQATVNALLSRVYLTMGNYKEAQATAEKALEGAPELLDFNELGYAPVESYPEMEGLPAQDVYNCETHKWTTIKYLYWKEFLFPRFTYARSQWIIPSDDLVSLYDQQNDRRFKLFFVEHGNRRMGVPYEAYRYNQFYDGRYIISGLTTAEMLLNKAEAQIRQGMWQEGLKTLDVLREKRYEAGTYISLSAGNQSEALSIVLAERRREMPFSMRIPDIKRYGVNEILEDDVTVVKNFFEISMSEVFIDKPKTYTIPSNSLLWAMPINDVEIGSSNGAIQQNRYE